MMNGRPHKPALMVAALLAVGTSCVVAATSLEAPAVADLKELRKPPADTQSPPPAVAKVMPLIKERYPQLLTQKIDGTPIITVLFGRDGNIERSDLTVFPQAPEKFKSSEAQFSKVGLKPEQVGYVVEQGIQTQTNQIVMVFTGGRDPGDPVASGLLPDTRATDRALVERFFPRALQAGASDGEGLWVMFAHDGTVLRTGREPVEASRLKHLLETRYKGIQISEMTNTSVFGPDSHAVKNAQGQELALYSVWLAEGSTLP